MPTDVPDLKYFCPTPEVLIHSQVGQPHGHSTQYPCDRCSSHIDEAWDNGRWGTRVGGRLRGRVRVGHEVGDCRGRVLLAEQHTKRESFRLRA